MRILLGGRKNNAEHNVWHTCVQSGQATSYRNRFAIGFQYLLHIHQLSDIGIRVHCHTRTVSNRAVTVERVFNLETGFRRRTNNFSFSSPQFQTVNKKNAHRLALPTGNRFQTAHTKKSGFKPPHAPSD